MAPDVAQRVEADIFKGRYGDGVFVLGVGLDGARLFAGGDLVYFVVDGQCRPVFEPEVEHMRDLIASAAERFPDVTFEFTDALTAFRKVLWPDGVPGEALDLELT